MENNINKKADQILHERFKSGKLVALATCHDDMPSVRAVNAYYENECFYIMTDASSGKMRELELNPKVALCGELFNGHGVAENIGHVLKKEHTELMKTLRVALAEWYSYGNVNEKDPNTVILKVKMTDGMVVSEGLKYNFFFK